MTTNFNPQETERLAERLERHGITHYEGCPCNEAAMLRAAVERVREERGYVKTLLQQADEAMERLAAAEKVIEAARKVVEMEATGTKDRVLSLPWWNDLAQALQEYDHG